MSMNVHPYVFNLWSSLDFVLVYMCPLETHVVEADPGSGETNYSSSAVTDYLQLSTQVWDHMRFLLLVLACQLMSLHWSCLASHIVKSS